MENLESIRRRPGGEMANRVLNFILITDCSGSMGDMGKIQELNNAIRGAIPLMQKAVADCADVEVGVRAIKFASGAEWHIGQPTKVDDLKWIDLGASGVTEMGKALSLVADELDPARMPSHGCPPILVLVSDGQPTDDFDAGLQRLMNVPWGARALRLAVAIGRDADLDVLRRFIGNPEIDVLQANNPDKLADVIRDVTATALVTATRPPTRVMPSPTAAPASIAKPALPSPGTQASAGCNPNTVW